MEDAGESTPCVFRDASEDLAAIFGRRVAVLFEIVRKRHPSVRVLSDGIGSRSVVARCIVRVVGVSVLHWALISARRLRWIVVAHMHPLKMSVSPCEVPGAETQKLCLCACTTILDHRQRATSLLCAAAL